MTKELSHHKMNDNAATKDVVDAVGLHNGLSVRNTEDISVAGKINTALNFPTAADYIRVPDFLVTSADKTKCSVFVWIKAAAQTNKWFFTKYDYGDGDTAIAMAIDGAGNNNLEVILSSTGAVNEKNYRGSQTIADNAFHHAGFIFNSGTLDLYVDGVKDPSVTKVKDLALPTLDDFSADILFNNLLNNGVVDANGMAGRVDDIRIYGIALTQDQIDLIYNDGAGTEEGLESLEAAAQQAKFDGAFNGLFCGAYS